MNIKKEFVNAIISLFRLDKNIFIIGAIEKIIEDVEPSDYVMLLAFLGDRNNEYERPIESINKGIKEFYDTKDGELFKYANSKAKGVFIIIKHLYENNMELKEGYMTNIQLGTYDYITIRLEQKDIEIINSLGVEEILKTKVDDAISILLEKYLGKKIKKTITEKIKDNSVQMLTHKIAKGFKMIELIELTKEHKRLYKMLHHFGVKPKEKTISIRTKTYYRVNKKLVKKYKYQVNLYCENEIKKTLLHNYSKMSKNGKLLVDEILKTIEYQENISMDKI